MLIATPINTPADDSNALHEVKMVKEISGIGAMLAKISVSFLLTSLARNREVQRLPERLSMLHHIVSSDLMVGFAEAMPISADPEREAALMLDSIQTVTGSRK